MWELVSGRIFAFAVLLVLFLLVTLFTYYTEHIPLPTVRRIAGLDAIEESVGRCTEMGRPVHFSIGDKGGLRSNLAPQIIAGVEVLRYVASVVAKYKSNLIVSTPFPEAIPLIEDTLKGGYADAGRPDYFDAEQIRYYPEGYTYTMGILGILTQENCGANIMIGPMSGGTILWGMTGQAVGAFGIAGTARQVQLPYLVVTFDYTLIGEEIYAAGAYVSKDPSEVSALLANDLMRALALILLVTGVIALALGSTVISSLIHF